MRKIVLIFLFATCIYSVYAAETVVVDGIKYEIIEKAKEAHVVAADFEYTDLIIPENFEYEGDIYTVTQLISIFKTDYRQHTINKLSIPKTVTYFSKTLCFGNYLKINELYIDDWDSWCSIDMSESSSFYGSPIPFSNHIYYKNEPFDGNIELSNNVTEIKQYAFCDLRDLKSIYLPPTIKYIGYAAFGGCTNLTSVTICDLEKWCLINFDGNSANPLVYSHSLNINGSVVQDLVIPDNVTEICSQAFSGLSKIKSVSFHSSLKSIGNSAFSGCSGLTSVTIPNSVTSIGTSAFSGCSGLTSVILPSSITSISSYAFSGCSGLASFSIPNSITSIGSSAFSGCNGFTSFSIPNSITSIGSSAFSGCKKLQTVKIGTGVKRIDSHAFARCENLETVYCNAENVPSTYSDAFQDSYVNYSKLYAPEHSLEAYKSTSPWSEFGTILPIGVETPVASITVNAESYTIYKGDKATLTVTVLPEDATDKTVAWSSSNSNVVSVDAITGEITAVSCGETVITATATDGSEMTGSITITVKDAGYALTDGTSFSNAEQFTCDELTYTRTFSDTNWQALYVPFSMQYDDWKDNFEIAYLNDAHQFDDDDDGVIDRTVLESVKLKEGSKTEPNTPYMIKAKVTGSQTITLTDATVYPAAENSFDVTSWFTKFIFTGTYHTVTNMTTAGHYAMAKGGLMQATSDAATLGSFRWYLDVTDRYGNPTPLASKSIRLSFDDGETTDIDIINADSPRHAEVYSISGIQLKGKLPKGLYISNGKKVVIK